MKFVKIDNFWWEYDINTPLYSATVYNLGLGRMTNLDITNNEIAEVNDITDLDWRGTKVLDKKYKTGWLLQNGKFYGCDGGYYDIQAKVVHGVSFLDLESQGAIKIAYTNKELVAYFYSNNAQICPSVKQIEYIKENLSEEHYFHMKSLRDRFIKYNGNEK